MNRQSRWMLDELAFAGPEHLDSAYVAGYEGKAGTDPSEDVTLLRDLGLSADDTVVDLGAGSGTFALAVATLCRRVVAVDVSAAMLALMNENAKRAGIANVESEQRGFLTYEHDGKPADVVYSRHALHHLPDFWKAIALQRIAAMLEPEGIFLLRDLAYSFDPRGAESAIEAWLAGAAASSELGWTRDELETHIREEHSTFSWLLEPMLARAGFEIQTAEHDASQISSTYVCIKRR